MSRLLRIGDRVIVGYDKVTTIEMLFVQDHHLWMVDESFVAYKLQLCRVFQKATIDPRFYPKVKNWFGRERLNHNRRCCSMQHN